MASGARSPSQHTIGEVIFRVLRRNVVIEDERWALDRATRVIARLLPSNPARFDVIIPWLTLMTAFTAPGRYIFFSRRLYERCATDEEVAFVLAHEIAHHDLGHVGIFETWQRRLSQAPTAELLALAFHAIERRIYGPEKECDAIGTGSISVWLRDSTARSALRFLTR